MQNNNSGFSPTFQARFFSRVSKSICWIWTGFKNKGGYGVVNTGIGNGKILAHRASWILHRGPIPTGINVLHNCPTGDNPACVNPDHLWIGTIADNNRDMFAKGRGRPQQPDNSGENHGAHKLTDAQVAEIRNLCDKGTMFQRDIARLYGVGEAQISRIKNRHQRRKQ